MHEMNKGRKNEIEKKMMMYQVLKEIIPSYLKKNPNKGKKNGFTCS